MHSIPILITVLANDSLADNQSEIQRNSCTETQRIQLSKFQQLHPQTILSQVDQLMSNSEGRSK